MGTNEFWIALGIGIANLLISLFQQVQKANKSDK
jgi:hypothetical protein